MIHVPGKHYWCTWVREFMDGRQKAAENVWGAAQSKMKSNSLNRYFIIFKMFWNYDWLWCHTKTTTTTTAHSLCRRMTHLHLFSIKKVWIARKLFTSKRCPKLNEIGYLLAKSAKSVKSDYATAELRSSKWRSIIQNEIEPVPLSQQFATLINLKISFNQFNTPFDIEFTVRTQQMLSLAFWFELQFSNHFVGILTASIFASLRFSCEFKINKMSMKKTKQKTVIKSIVMYRNGNWLGIFVIVNGLLWPINATFDWRYGEAVEFKWPKGSRNHIQLLIVDKTLEWKQGTTACAPYTRNCVITKHYLINSNSRQ